MQNLEELQTWLSRQNNIPKKRHRVNTLMDIVGVTHLSGEQLVGRICLFLQATRESWAGQTVHRHAE